MAEIRFSPLLLNKLDELIKTLFNEAYFGFFESSEDYVNNLIDFIYSIPSLKYKPTIDNQFGTFYCKYKHNSKTTWYITFDIEEEFYIMQNIINNHSADYPILFP